MNQNNFFEIRGDGINFMVNDVFFAALHHHRIFLDKRRYASGDKILFPNHCELYPYCGFYGTLKTFFSIRSFSYSNANLNNHCSIQRYTSVAAKVTISGTRHPYERISSSNFTYDPQSELIKGHLRDFESTFKPVDIAYKENKITIGNDVWIGDDVWLSPNITIGDGAVIAARSVITKDVPAFAVVGGVPAKIIKYKFDEDIIQRIKNLKWWRYKFADFGGMDISTPEIFLDQLEEKIDRGLSAYYPEPITNRLLLQTLTHLLEKG